MRHVYLFCIIFWLIGIEGFHHFLKSYVLFVFSLLQNLLIWINVEVRWILHGGLNVSLRYTILAVFCKSDLHLLTAAQRQDGSAKTTLGVEFIVFFSNCRKQVFGGFAGPHLNKSIISIAIENTYISYFVIEIVFLMRKFCINQGLSYQIGICD